MTDTEVLLAAADLIERNGLHKGEEWPGVDKGLRYSPGLPCCVLGAIYVVTGSAAEPSLMSKLHSAVGGLVTWWSDDSTQAEVVATLRAVATSEET